MFLNICIYQGTQGLRSANSLLIAIAIFLQRLGFVSDGNTQTTFSSDDNALKEPALYPRT